MYLYRRCRLIHTDDVICAAQFHVGASNIEPRHLDSYQPGQRGRLGSVSKKGEMVIEVEVGDPKLNQKASIVNQEVLWSRASASNRAWSGSYC